MSINPDEPDKHNSVGELRQRIVSLEAKLLEREERFRALTDAAPVGLFIDDAKGKAIYVNRKCAELIGVDPENALDFDWIPFLHPEDRERMVSEWANAFNNNAEFHLEYRWLHPNGRIVWTLGEVIPIRGEGGKTKLFIGTLTDITDRKKAELEREQLQEQLLQAQKMESIGRLAGGIAHDFNNILGGIIGATDLIQSAPENSERREKFLGVILESAQRAAVLIGKLLSFARKQPIISSVIDIASPIRESILLLENTVDKRIKLHCEFPEDEMPVVGDHVQLQSAFLNLLINAAHAMPEGGDLFVNVSRIELDARYCETTSVQLAAGPYVEIEVRDTGCGIPKSDLTNIFEPFFSTKDQGKGTGLGLAAVLGTIQQHHGAVLVHSEVEGGTCFRVQLPISAQNAQPAPVVPEYLLHGSGTILYVDDEDILRATVGVMLEDMGYDVLFAEDGRQALALFREQVQNIDLVILDQIMPEMNGRDCFLNMKKINPDVRVILATGFSHENEIESMKAAGLVGVIRKPFRARAFSLAVHQALCQSMKNSPQ